MLIIGSNTTEQHPKFGDIYSSRVSDNQLYLTL